MNNVLMYCHNGSGNHGCEAIIRATVNILNQNGVWRYYQISRNPAEDCHYGVDELVKLLPEYSPVCCRGWEFWRAYLEQKLMNKHGKMDYLSSRVSFRVPEGNTVSLSIGGDNYCYKGYQLYTRYHQISRLEGHKTVLWGCSVDPEFLEYDDLLDDLKTFDKILVRESISYEAMYAKGLRNIALYPDPAFTLKMCTKAEVLPKKNTVGINISPMALQYASENSDVLGSYKVLIQYILQKTDMNIALIPHVVWEYNDDREVLKKLKAYFAQESRVTLVDDMDCTRLKAYISKLRFFVGARTHATIAAYSTGVPTLVAGYSVKSRGIAKDIFGTEDNYVVPVNQMVDTQELKNAFCWIMENEKQIRSYLHDFMPGYIQKAYEAENEIHRLLPVEPRETLKTGILKEQCVGCAACTSVCKAGCLEMKMDEEGFPYPAFKSESCVNCGKCIQVCPIKKEKEFLIPQSFYAVKHKDEQIRRNSSSGGVFSALAEEVLKQGGVIYGAALDENCVVRHIEVSDFDGLNRLRGAKYSQSNIGEVYGQIKRRLADGQKVLFSGTPCQVAGLRQFVGKPDQNLICIDFICHGVPSPLVWKRYVEQISAGELPQNINFRSKESGWSRYRYSIRMEFASGKIFCEKNGDNLFLQGMVQNLYLRPSCSICPFKGNAHTGDITLGDFWGIWNLNQEFDDDKGVSAVIINNDKGYELMKMAASTLELKNVTLENIKHENPSWGKNFYAHSKRENFFKDVHKSKDVSALIAQYITNTDNQSGLIDYLVALKRKIRRL